MNSSEQKDFEHITPTQGEIQVTVAAIKKLLTAPELNGDLEKGYQEAFLVLLGSEGDAEHLGAKGKAVVLAAKDYLDGTCSRETLLGFARG